VAAVEPAVTKLYLNRVALTLVVRVGEQVFARHLPSSPRVVGEALAEQVRRYVQRQQLGYYPALDFFRDLPEALDPQLLDAAEHIAWFTCNMARDEVRRKLRPVFSSLNFESIQSLAFTLPPVRPNQPNAPADLVRHYTPDTAKMALVASSFQKTEMPEALSKWASHLAFRWLKESFESVQITSARPL